MDPAERLTCHSYNSCVTVCSGLPAVDPAERLICHSSNSCVFVCSGLSADGPCREVELSPAAATPLHGPEHGDGH